MSSQNLYEEIDFQPASSTGGQNYGWRIMEGFHCYNPNPCSSAGLTLPVIEYAHGTNGRIAQLTDACVGPTLTPTPSPAP